MSDQQLRVIHNDGNEVTEEVKEFFPEELTVIDYPCQYSASEAISRARSKLGSEWELLTNNCEHFVTWAKNGKGKSGQVLTGLTVGGIGGVVGVGTGAAVGSAITSVAVGTGAAVGSAITGVAVGTGAAVGSAAATGAAAGSVVPGVGTVVGAFVGGIVGFGLGVYTYTR